MELEQKTFEDTKHRMLTEFTTEKERLLKEIQQKEQELEMQRDKQLKDKKEMAEHLNREFNEKVRMIEKRNQVSEIVLLLFKHCLLPSIFCYFFLLVFNVSIFIHFFPMAHFFFPLITFSVKSNQLASNLNRISQFGNVNMRQHLNCAKLKKRTTFVNSAELNVINKSIQLLPK